MFLAGDEITILRALTEDIFLVRHLPSAAVSFADRSTVPSYRATVKESLGAFTVSMFACQRGWRPRSR